MPRQPRTALEAAEFWLLVGVAACLPLVEAPKTIFLGLYGIVWIVNRVRARDFGGPWDRWDTLIVAWIASGWLAAAFAGLHANEWRGPMDLVRYGVALLLVRRTRFTEREIAILFGALVAATLVALAHGYWRVWTAPAEKPRALGLRSVGHVNHSAIYLAIVTGLVLAAVLAWWPRTAAWLRAAGVTLVVLLGISVLVTSSRGAIGALAVLCIAIGIAWWPRSRWPAYIVAAAIAIGAAGAIGLRVEAVRKQEDFAQRGIVLSLRDKVWNVALAAVERYPWFGVGIDNYNQISMERVEQWRREARKDFDPELFMGTSHGHSLYFNTLAERGIVGFLALAAVLGAWALSLARGYPARSRDPTTWTVWGAALSAWFISVVVGTVNTTLHHEHALLSMLLLGVWLSWQRHGGDAAPD